ncbi:MAG: hypothetical protein RBT81_04970 [Gammaproteobacteria bacterium]|jgi:hypothetical protein|nr:hypothetical protein [Gammaproteobacteria bacterium]
MPRIFPTISQAGTAARPASIPCYVSGKGMHATSTTWDFKTLVIQAMESSGLGYDTRYRYYQPRFPHLSGEGLARLICDPIEYYDADWPKWRQEHATEADETRLVTRFMLERDNRFRDEAQVAIYCYDEAGFGSGVNTMRFLAAGKRVLGFHHEGSPGSGPLNLSNVMQLEIDYPDLVTLNSYRDARDIPAMVIAWLLGIQATDSPLA